MKNFYYLVVLAILLNISGCLGDDPISSGTPNKLPSPFTIVVGNLTNNSAEISWTESIDPENTQVTYDVHYNDSLVAKAVTEREYTFQNLEFNSEFVAKVIANDADGGNLLSQSSEIVLVKNLRPTAFTITLNSKTNSDANFSWTASTDPEGANVLYLLSYRIDNGGDNPRILLEPSFAGTSYQLTGLSSSTPYKFSVLAYDEDGLGYEEEIVFSTVLNQRPVITNDVISVSNITSTSVSLSWVAATDPELTNIVYKLYFDNINGTPVGTTSNTSFNLTGLTQNQQYKVFVVAEDGGGEIDLYSPIEFKTKTPNPPNNITGFQAAETYPRSIKLTWNPTSDPDANDSFRYYIYLKKSDPSNDYNLIAVEYSNKTFYWFRPITKPNANTTYSFKIKAVDASTNESAEVSLNATTASGSLNNFYVVSNFEQVEVSRFSFDVNENSTITKIAFPTGLNVLAADDNTFLSSELDAFVAPGSTRVYIRFSQAQLNDLKASANKTATIHYNLGGNSLTKTVDFSIIN